MKFTNGFWLMRGDVTPLFAVEYAGHELRDKDVYVYAATRHIAGRGDTLNCALLTLIFSSPAGGVIRTELVHHIGEARRGPCIEKEPAGSPQSLRVTDEKDTLIISDGQNAALEIVIDKRPKCWSVTYKYDGKALTESSFRNMAHMRRHGGHDGYINPSPANPDFGNPDFGSPGVGYTVAELSLSVGELVYGLGERFTPFVRNGQTVSMWNEDGGTASEQAYKNIPFYMSNRGYGVLVDSLSDVEFEIASEKVSRVQFSQKGERLAFYVIAGPMPADVLYRYTSLFGRPALPPAWSFGLWLTTSFTTSYSEQTVMSMLDGMRDRDIPLSVFHFDCFWMRQYTWCDFTWNPEEFPDPSGMIARIKRRGLRVCVWINPYIAQKSALFDEGTEQGFLLRREGGDVWQTDLWQAGMGIVDFTNPDAVRWYLTSLEKLLDMGVDCFKTDFGERVPVRGVVWHDGADPIKMHNAYTYLFNRAVFSLLEKKRGIGEACLFARSASAGGQRFPAHWGGDCGASYPSMAETLRGGLSLSLCGFGFWSHDIGGFEQTATPDLYKRWCAFGLLSTHSRLHGSESYRVPWLFDEESVRVLRFFTRMKYELMPYLFGHAVLSHRTGTPVLRPMLYEFLSDPVCHTAETQYMLGDSLLAAPVFSEDGEACYYLPEGRWTHYISGEIRDGGKYYRERFDYMYLPLFVRPGAVFVTGSRHDRPDYNYRDGMTVRIYEPREGAISVSVPDIAGHGVCRVHVNVTDTGITVSVSDNVSEGTAGILPWRVFLSSGGKTRTVTAKQAIVYVNL